MWTRVGLRLSLFVLFVFYWHRLAVTFPIQHPSHGWPNLGRGSVKINMATVIFHSTRRACRKPISVYLGDSIEL